MKLIDGYTPVHEYVTIDLPGVKKDEDCRLDRFEEAVKEFKSLYGYGAGNILEVTNLGIGRNMEYIKRVSEQAGTDIIVSIGFYKEPFLPGCVYGKPAEELAQLMERELTQGVDGSWGPVPGDTGMCVPAIGEFGTSKQQMTDMEKKVLDVMAAAVVKAGMSVTTHTTLRTMGAEQANYLMERGVKPEKIITRHMDLSQNMKTIFSVLRRGVNVGFDTVGKLNYCPDTFRAEAPKRIHGEGMLFQVVLSTDITRKSHLEYRGGIGYAYMFQSLLPLLSESGFTRAQINVLLRKSPRRILLGAGY